jgi:hypothetical protein
VGRWVAEWRWVARLVARLPCYGSALGSNPDTSQNYKMDDIPTQSSPPQKRKILFETMKSGLFERFLKIKFEDFLVQMRRQKTHP